MNTVRWELNQMDGYVIKGYMYKSLSLCKKGQILILHNLGEHQLRYRKISYFLSQQGFDVYTYNYRGHGHEVPINQLGIINAKDGWDQLVNDCEVVIDKIISKGQKTVYIIGNHFGSLIAKAVGKQKNYIKGIIFISEPGQSWIRSYISHSILKGLSKLKGEKTKSHFIYKRLLLRYNQQFKPYRTLYDWLSRDKIEVDIYINDPYCGFPLSYGFYMTYIKGLVDTHNIYLEVPVLSLYGAMDPVSQYRKYKKKKGLKKAEQKKITVKSYPFARHDLLKEVNDQIIFKDILKWLQGIDYLDGIKDALVTSEKS